VPDAGGVLEVVVANGSALPAAKVGSPNPVHKLIIAITLDSAMSERDDMQAPCLNCLLRFLSLHIVMYLATGKVIDSALRPNSLPLSRSINWTENRPSGHKLLGFLGIFLDLPIKDDTCSRVLAWE
jgi:hypothetical protein